MVQYYTLNFTYLIFAFWFHARSIGMYLYIALPADCSDSGNRHVYWMRNKTTNRQKNNTNLPLPVDVQMQKVFQLQGAKPPDPHRGLCSLYPRWGLSPQTPVIGSRSRARHAAPHPTSPSLLSASDTTLLSGHRACSRYRVKIGVVQSWKSEWFRLESLDPVPLLIYIIIIPCIPGNVCPRLSPTALLPLFLAVHGKRQHGIWISLKIWMLLFLRQTKREKMMMRMNLTNHKAS